MPTVTETLDPEELVLMSLGVMVSIFISDSVRMSLKLSVSKPKTKYVRIKNLKTGGERAGESDVTPEFLEKRTHLSSNTHKGKLFPLVFRRNLLTRSSHATTDFSRQKRH